MKVSQKFKISIEDLPDEFYKGKKVFVRVDLNVPTSKGIISEDYRIRRTISTIDYLLKRGARIILGSHFGRPGGKIVKKLSLKPITERLSQVLNARQVKFVDGCIGEVVQYAVSRIDNSEVLLLENLRFNKGEINNDEEFAKQLASLADIYVNDAFSTSHRKQASTYGIFPYFNYKLAGFQVRKEMETLSKVRDNPKRPFTLVIGGSKIKDKITALKNLIDKADKVLIGGGVAYTFLLCKGLSIGNSIVESDYIDWAKEILNQNENKVLLPVDHIIAQDKKKKSEVKIVPNEIPEGYMGFDIGPKTTSIFTHEIMNAEGTIFWNGPMGVFEIDEFSRGTIDVARSLAIAYWRGTCTVVGGGDTTAALRKADVLETEVDYVSTGGGATLEFLGGSELPGITILDDLNIYEMSTA